LGRWKTNFPFGTHGVKEGRKEKELFFFFCMNLKIGDQIWVSFWIILSFAITLGPFYVLPIYTKLDEECTLTCVGHLGHHGTQHFSDCPWTHIFRRNFFFVVLWLSKRSQKTKETLLSWTLPLCPTHEKSNNLEWVNHKIFFPAPHLISGKVKSMLHMVYTLQGQDCMCPFAKKQKKLAKKAFENI
jgi:hypothetical protein